MKEEKLIEALMETVSDPVFHAAVADNLLSQLQNLLGPHPFEECDPMPGADGDFLGYVVAEGSVQAAKWAIEKRVMNPPDLDVAAYTTIALLEPHLNADPAMADFLLKTYGCSFVEIPYGDLPVESQAMVKSVLGVNFDDEE